MHRYIITYDFQPFLYKNPKTTSFKDRESFNNFVNTNTSFNPHNMFICKSKKVLKEYYSVVFPWLERCEKHFKFDNLNIYDNDYDNYNLRVTKFGLFLRKTSLDELPQLWSIVLGKMSFIGPRPLLSTEKKLLSLRETFKGNNIKPGITGWAQVNGRDELSIIDKVALDVEYLNRQSFWFDIKILWMTFLKVIKRDGVSH